MNRTILVLAAVVLFVTSSISADTTNPIISSSYKVNMTKITKVNTFCLAIAKGDYTMVEKLIEMGTNVNEYSHGKTPLMYAARYNRVEIAKLLIANGAKIKSKDTKGQTALRYAELANANAVVTLIKSVKKKRKA